MWGEALFSILHFPFSIFNFKPVDIIQLLPDSVANQIAAGEVIQRPASVIKELVENAIDAGAKNIQVLVCDAGKASVQVIDDGSGMSDTDARLAFERHATSKIRQATDLFSLHTMGFRGEALASIAAVAQVTLQTRMKDEEVGTRLVIEGSRVVEQEVVSCPVGSNFLIENLFFNIPARRKFLKSNNTEMTNIIQAFERIVLVYPEVNFSLYNNGMETMQLRATTTHQRILDVFGKRLNQQLLPLETETTLCNIKGFVGKPESAKKKGFLQYFFVNGRYMKHPYFHKAVLSAFDRLLPDGEQVSYFIYLTVNPEDIDVNIHPVKTEIKFNNEQAIWQILMAAVRDAVGKFTDLNTLDFDAVGKPDIPVFSPENNPFVEVPKIDFDPQYNPFNEVKDDDGGASSPKTTSHSSYKEHSAPAIPHRTSAKGWEEMFGGDMSEGNSNISVNAPQTDLFSQEPAVATGGMRASILSYDIPDEHYQYHGKYIVTQMNSSLVLVDQNRASQRVLYEKYMADMQAHTAHTQKVLFPDVVQFPPSYSASLPAILDDLRTLGFEITDLGGGSYSVAGVPAGLGGMDPVSLVNDLVADAMERGGATEKTAIVSERTGLVDRGTGATEQFNSILAMSLARKAATPYGEILSNADIDKLLRQLFDCHSQRYTPDGKLIIVTFDETEIDKRFG